MRARASHHTRTPLVYLLVFTLSFPSLILYIYTEFIGSQANSRHHYPSEHPLRHILLPTPDRSRQTHWLSLAESSTFCLHRQPYILTKSSNSRAPGGIGEWNGTECIRTVCIGTEWKSKNNEKENGNGTKHTVQ